MKRSLFKRLAFATSICLTSCFYSTSVNVKPTIAQEIQYKDYEGLENKLGAYFTVDEYEKKIKELAEENPMIISLKKLGESWHKRPIYVLKISDENKHIEGTTKNEPQILILAHQHARELISGVTAIATAEHLIKNYDIDEKIKSYVDNNEIYIVPLANPDGLAIIEGSFRQVIDAEKAKKHLKDFSYPNLKSEIDPDTKLKETWWRKNARDNNNDGIISPAEDGIDLNRNYSTGWGKRGESLYFDEGPCPFSEPETKTIKKLVESLDNLVIAVDLHSYGGLVIHPPGYKEGETKDEKMFKKIAEEMTKKQFYEKYDIIKLNEIYGTPFGGTFTDWTYTEYDVISFIVEVYKKGTNLPYLENVNPPQQDIKKVTENVIPMLLYLFEISDNPKKILKEDCS